MYVSNESVVGTWESDANPLQRPYVSGLPPALKDAREGFGAGGGGVLRRAEVDIAFFISLVSPWPDDPHITYADALVTVSIVSASVIAMQTAGKL
jgi:hypothetical protein